MKKRIFVFISIFVCVFLSLILCSQVDSTSKVEMNSIPDSITVSIEFPGNGGNRAVYYKPSDVALYTLKASFANETVETKSAEPGQTVNLTLKKEGIWAFEIKGYDNEGNVIAEGKTEKNLTFSFEKQNLELAIIPFEKKPDQIDLNLILKWDTPENVDESILPVISDIYLTDGIFLNRVYDLKVGNTYQISINVEKGDNDLSEIILTKKCITLANYVYPEVVDTINPSEDVCIKRTITPNSAGVWNYSICIVDSKGNKSDEKSITFSAYENDNWEHTNELEATYTNSIAAFSFDSNNVINYSDTPGDTNNWCYYGLKKRVDGIEYIMTRESGYRNSGFGLVFMQEKSFNDSDVYYMIYYTVNGSIKITESLKEDSAWKTTEIIPWTKNGNIIQGYDAQNILRIESENNALCFYVNGCQVYRLENPKFTSGYGYFVVNKNNTSYSTETINAKAMLLGYLE